MIFPLWPDGFQRRDFEPENTYKNQKFLFNHVKNSSESLLRRRTILEAFSKHLLCGGTNGRNWPVNESQMILREVFQKGLFKSTKQFHRSM
jgi:hypothetical protein